MRVVTDAYKLAAYKTPIRCKNSGTITCVDGTVINITDDNIRKGRFTIDDKAVSSNDFELGAVYVGQLNMSIYTDIDRNKLKGATVNMTYALKTGDTWESLKLKPYVIDVAVRTTKYIDITAYDNIALLDKPYDNIATDGTIYEVLCYISLVTGISLGQTQAQIESLANGTRYIKVAETGKYDTWRDVVSCIATILCTFATIDSNGALVFKEFVTTTTADITKDQRQGLEISEVVTNYQGVRCTLDNVTYTMLATGYHEGTIFTLPNNPLISENSSKDNIKSTLQNIADRLVRVSYTACKFDTIVNPAIELGDLLSLKDGNTEICKCLVMSNTYTLHALQSIEAISNSEKLSSAKSSYEKAVSGVAYQSDENETAVNTFCNAKQLTITTADKEIARIDFVTKKAINGLFNITVLLETTDISNSADITFKISIGGAYDTTYEPKQTLGNGKHIISFIYPVTGVPANTSKAIRVYANISSGVVNINPLGVRATFSASGLSDRIVWDGIVEIEDTFGDISISPEIDLCDMTDNDDTILLIPKYGAITDIYKDLTFTFANDMGKNRFPLSYAKVNFPISSYPTAVFSKNSFEIRVWATQVLSNAQVIELFEPNTQYTISLDVELLSYSSLPLFQNGSGSNRLTLYNNTLNPTLGSAGLITSVGHKVHVENVFTTPTDFTNYRMLLYTQRHTDGTTVELDNVKFSNVKIEKGNQATDWSPAPEDGFDMMYTPIEIVGMSDIAETEET